MKISIDQAKAYINQVLAKHGYNSQEVEKISEVLMYAVLRETTQGFAKLFGWHIQKDPKAQDPVFKNITPSIIRFDAKRNNNMYVCNLATDKLIEMTKLNGLALVGVYNNNNNSSGAIGFYTSKIASRGYVGLMFSSADPIGGIAPAGSKKGVFGTNPLSISIPYKNSQITLDMSTAKYTWGDLVQIASNKKNLQFGFAYDKDGKITTDPKEAMQGSVAAFDGMYKGLGLAFMLQVLAGALVGSTYEQSDETCDYGNLIIAIDPEKLAGKEFFEKQIDKLINAYKKEGGKGLFLPGERGDVRAKKNLENDTVEISEEMLEKVKKFLD